MMSDVARRARRVKLRLDDGSLVAHSSLLGGTDNGVLCLPASECVRHNLISEAHFQRLQRLLAEVPEPAVAQPAPKKQKTEARPAPLAPLLPTPLPTLPSPRGAAPRSSDWRSKCKGIWDAAIQALGPAYVFYMERVSESDVPDYYKTIPRDKAMWMNLVLERLNNGTYTSPDRFYQDLSQIWANSKRYNPPGNPVRKAAEAAEKAVDALWSTSGMSQERQRRAAAGAALSSKYDLEDLVEEEAPPRAAPRPATSKGNNSKGGGGGGSSKKIANGGLGRMSSQEVVSSGGARYPPQAALQPPAAVPTPPAPRPAPPAAPASSTLSSTRRSEIAAALQEGINQLDPDKINELIAMLPPSAMTTDEEGETELDFEALDDATLMHLEKWMKQSVGGGAGGGGAAPATTTLSANPSVRLEDESEAGDDDGDDEDYTE